MSEFIGRPNTEASDKKIVEFVRKYSDFNEIHIYCTDLILNENGEYIRMKQPKIFHEFASVSNQKYDKIIAVDQWAKEQMSKMIHDDSKKQQKEESIDISEKKEKKPAEKEKVKSTSIKTDISK